MANPYAGEAALVINGIPHVMKLTLGALAELETALETGSLVELAQRFEGGSFSTRDVLGLLAAGLKGGGHRMTVAELAAAEIAGGPLGAARVAAELLARAFLMPGEA